jgi:aspartyl-tRNA synthetase
MQKDFAVQFYGKSPLNQSQERTGELSPICHTTVRHPFPGRKRTDLATITEESVGERILFRARVNTLRAQGNKMVFFNLRQRADSIQGLLIVTEGKVSKQMVKWAASVATESIVLVEGVIQKPVEPIKSASISEAEVLIEKVSHL